MGKKFIISESEKNDIRKMYGLISEQSIKRVSIQGKQPVDNTDWDLVHGILGSKRIDDDLEKRVGDELQTGNFRVSKVYLTSKKIGNEIVTDGAVDLIPVTADQNPHKYFTTRGSIGGDFENRHDTQVQGLEDRLKNYYKGDVTVFGPYTINVEGTNYKFKQSFFAIEGKETQQSQQPGKSVKIVGNGFNDLRNKLKSQTAGAMIDENSVEFDINTYTVTYNTGNKKIQNMSLIIDDQGQLENRLPNIRKQNPTMVEKDEWKGQVGNIEWIFVIIY